MIRGKLIKTDYNDDTEGGLIRRIKLSVTFSEFSFYIDLYRFFFSSNNGYKCSLNF